MLLKGTSAPLYTPPPGACWLPVADGRANPLIGALRRPLSSDAVFYPDDHQWHQRWLSFTGASGKGFNFGAAQFGVDVFDYDAPGTLFTITKDPAGGGDQANILNDGPMHNFRLPTALALNPDPGKDSNVNIYRADEQPLSGGTWYSFASLRKASATTATAVSCFKFQSFTAQGWGSPRTGSTAAKIAKVGTMLTRNEMFGAGGVVEHAIHVALGVTRKGGVALLGKGMRWPATDRDTAADKNDGVIDYGAWGFIKPESRGGPDITTLGLSDCGMRMARGLQRYGLVVTDMGGLVCKGRCDQTFSAAERSEMNAQFVKLYPYIRFLQTQSDATRYIGGNSDPVGPYCANDR